MHEKESSFNKTRVLKIDHKLTQYTLSRVHQLKYLSLSHTNIKPHCPDSGWHIPAQNPGNDSFLI